jgi:DNA-binding beta-propeller fold protein YncE
MLKFEYRRVVFQRAKQTEMLRALAFAIALFIILGQIAIRFDLVRAIGQIPAQNVLGQLEHSTTPTFSPDLTESAFASNNSDVIGPLGFDLPGDVGIDYVNHRMFVADSLNNRILVFDLNENNEIINYEADYVLGQSDFSTNNVDTTIVNLNTPIYLAVDQDNERLFVSDTNNNRILVFDISIISSGLPAENVLGQIDFETADGQLKDNGLNQPLGIALNSGGTNLFVSDSQNNRVMVFDVTEILNGEPAVNVLGQTGGFEAGASGSGDTFLNTPYDLAYESSTNSLFVADSQNNRVMVFDVSSIADGEPAVNVLGQSDFGATSGGVGSFGLNVPQGLEVGGGSLYVADSGNNRVMVFDVSSIADGEPAVNVLGQVDFDSLDFDWPNNSLQIFGSFFSTGNLPAIYLNSDTDELFVSDQATNRITVFDVTEIVDGEEVSNVLGFYNEGTLDVFGAITFENSVVNSGGGTINAYGFEDLISVEIDTVNHRLFAVSTYNVGRILVFDLNGENEIVNFEADYVLGQGDFVTAGNSDDSAGFDEPHDLAFDPDNSYLYVSDSGLDRVLVFDVSSITNNEPAIHVLGQGDFDIGNNSNAVDQSTLDYPTGLALDSQNNLLYVADSQNNRVMVFDVSSITDGEPAVNVLGQVDFLSEGTALTATGMNLPHAVTVDSLNDKLYVADKQNFRVLVFDVSEITNGESALNVLGSETFTDPSSGTTDSSFNFSAGFYELPGVEINSLNQKLFISDSGNNRVMVFDVSSVTNGEAAVAVIGQDDFTSSVSDVSQTSLDTPKGIYLDSETNRIFVADSGNNRTLEFGFVEITTSALESANGGVSYTQELNSSSFQGVVSYELYSGTLPEGLTLTGNEITGTPTATANSSIYNFSIIAKDTVAGVGDFYSNPVDFSLVVVGTGVDTGGGGGGSSGSDDNVYPIVEIINPEQDQIFELGQNVNVSVQAVDVDGEIDRVELF